MRCRSRSPSTRASARRCWCMTDFINIRVVPGSLRRAGGRSSCRSTSCRPPPIPGMEITYQFNAVSVDLGVTRKVTRRVRRGSRKRRTFRYSLVRTPAACDTGASAPMATLGFPDVTTLPPAAPDDLQRPLRPSSPGGPGGGARSPLGPTPSGVRSACRSTHRLPGPRTAASPRRRRTRGPGVAATSGSACR
jgi:hypothetical protein